MERSAGRSMPGEMFLPFVTNVTKVYPGYRLQGLELKTNRIDQLFNNFFLTCWSRVQKMEGRSIFGARTKLLNEMKGIKWWLIILSTEIVLHSANIV